MVGYMYFEIEAGIFLLKMKLCIPWIFKIPLFISSSDVLPNQINVEEKGRKNCTVGNSNAKHNSPLINQGKKCEILQWEFWESKGQSMWIINTRDYATEYKLMHGYA